jgi:hypothetical protein
MPRIRAVFAGSESEAPAHCAETPPALQALAGGPQVRCDSERAATRRGLRLGEGCDSERAATRRGLRLGVSDRAILSESKASSGRSPGSPACLRPASTGSESPRLRVGSRRLGCASGAASESGPGEQGIRLPYSIQVARESSLSCRAPSRARRGACASSSRAGALPPPRRPRRPGRAAAASESRSTRPRAHTGAPTQEGGSESDASAPGGPHRFGVTVSGAARVTAGPRAGPQRPKRELPDSGRARAGHGPGTGRARAGLGPGSGRP